MAGHKIFNGITVGGCFKIFKPVTELDNIAVILELYDVQQIKFDAFMARNQLRATRINFIVVVKS